MSSLDMAFGAALVLILVPIAVADFRTMIIPDWLNLSLAGAGLLYQGLSRETFPLAAIVFAAVMLAGFWLVRLGYRSLRGRAGLGLGDVKMAGASATWFSPWNAPLFLMAACFSALIFVLFSAVFRGRVDGVGRIPFGPFVGFGLLATWVLERSGYPTFIPGGGY